MKDKQRKDMISFFIFLLIFVTMIGTIYSETRISSLSVDIVYSEDIDAPETLDVTSSQYTPTPVVRVVESSSLDNNTWAFRSNYAWARFNVALRGVSKLVIGITISALEMPVELSLVEFGYLFMNSTTVESLQTKNHTLEISYTGTNASQSVRLMDVHIRLGDFSWSDFRITRFWIDAFSTVDLCPVTIDLRRTNGENFYSNPWLKTMGFYGQPKVSLNLSVIYPRKINDTIFLPEGNYNVTMDWNRDLLGNFSLSNNSIVITWHIKCVRLDFDLTQDVSGLYVELHGNNFYYKPSLLYSPSLYLSPVYLAAVRIRCETFSFAHAISTDVIYERGQNQNITFIVRPNLLSIAGISITPGRLLIIACSLIFVIGSLLVGRKRVISDYRILAFLLIFLGFCLPWMQVTQSDSAPMTPTISEFTETWDICPALFTSISSQDNFFPVIAPSFYPLG